MNSTQSHQSLTLNSSSPFVLTTSSGQTLTLGAGGLRSAQGTQTVNISLSLSASQTWLNQGTLLTIGATGVKGTITLPAGTTLTVDGSGQTWVNNQFTGSGSLIKNGTGTLAITDGGIPVSAGFSSYSGTTQINAGILLLDMGNSTSSPLQGSITVGDGTGTDRLVTRWRDQIGDSTSLSVRSSGSVLIDDGYYSNGQFSEAIGSLSLQGGAQVTTSADCSITLNGNVTHDGTGTATATIGGTLLLGGSNRTFNVGNSSAATDLLVSAAVGGNTGVGLVKTGAGTMQLSGTNSYTGATSVTGGTLLVTGTVNSTSGVSISGGTLALGSSERVTNSAPVTLGNGGTLQLANPSGTLTENVGALTLTGTGAHVIDFGSSAGVLRFLASNTAAWAGRLAVWNWSGSVTGGGTDQLFFGTNGSGLTTAQLGLIDFFSDSGSTPLGSAVIRSNGEVVASSLAPVPEPAAALATLLLAAPVFWRTRRAAESAQRGR